jgi:1-acyl-sn-glycerol-3-phosphate acyltransferase
MTDTASAAPTLNRLRQALYAEIFRAYALSEKRAIQRLVRMLMWLPATLLSRKALQFENRVAAAGFCEASRQFLPDFTADIDVRGQEQIPRHGPLVIASNHPGTIDFLLLSAQLHRQDIKMIAREMDFLRQLPAIASHLIFSTRDTLDRFGVLRAVLRHLQSGGCLLFFPSGNLDPDPAVQPGTRDSLATWSRSLDLILRKIPETAIVPVIVSGLISENVLQLPVIRSQQGRFRQQVSAEIFQISSQLILPGRFAPNPRITFGAPVFAPAQAEPPGRRDVLEGIITRAAELLEAFHPHLDPPRPG